MPFFDVRWLGGGGRDIGDVRKYTSVFGRTNFVTEVLCCCGFASLILDRLLFGVCGMFCFNYLQGYEAMCNIGAVDAEFRNCTYVGYISI